MSQLAEKAEKLQPKSALIKDAAFKWDDPLDLEGELTEEAVSYTHLTLPTILLV